LENTYVALNLNFSIEIQTSKTCDFSLCLNIKRLSDHIEHIENNIFHVQLMYILSRLFLNNEHMKHRGTKNIFFRNMSLTCLITMFLALNSSLLKAMKKITF